MKAVPQRADLFIFGGIKYSASRRKKYEVFSWFFVSLELPNDNLALRRWRAPCISFVIPLYFHWNPFMNTKEIQGTRCPRKTKLSLGSSRETKNQAKHFRFLPRAKWRPNLSKNEEIWPLRHDLHAAKQNHFFLPGNDRISKYTATCSWDLLKMISHWRQLTLRDIRGRRKHESVWPYVLSII